MDDTLSENLYFFLTSGLDDAQLDLLSTYTYKYTFEESMTSRALVEVVRHIADAKRNKSLFITNEQLELLCDYTQKHRLAEFMELIVLAKEARLHLPAARWPGVS